MIRKFKNWLYNRFLPAYCRDDLMEENARLLAANAEQKREIERLNAYIAGMQTALRRQTRITINGGEVRKE